MLQLTQQRKCEKISTARRVCHYKNLQINPLYGQVSQLTGQIRSYCKKLIANRTNRIVMKTCRQQQDKSYRNQLAFVIHTIKKHRS